MSRKISMLFPYTTLFRSFLNLAQNSFRAVQGCSVRELSIIVSVERERAAIRFLDTGPRSEEHTSELQSRQYLVCRLLLEKKKSFIASMTQKLTLSDISDE